MEDWTKKTDAEVFSTVGEMPGSMAAYWRDIEMKRRHYLLAKGVSDIQIRAAQAEIEAADATKVTAIWTRVSAIAMVASVAAVLSAAFIGR